MTGSILRSLWFPLALAVVLAVPAALAEPPLLSAAAKAGLAGALVWFLYRLATRDRSPREWLAEAFFLRAGLSRLESALMAGAMAALIGAVVLIGEWWLVPVLLLLPASGAKGMIGRPADRAVFMGMDALLLGAGILILLGQADGPLPRWPLGLGVLALALCGWAAVEAVSKIETGRTRTVHAFAALWFGALVLAVWEIVTRGYNVPPVILPPPSSIFAALAANLPTLRADFVQTVIRSVLPGYAIGCGAAFVTAVLTDRSPFLQRGLLPLGNLAAALPIVGIAPIMVMWFGFDWQSKAAVVVIMCFFPMLVNTMQGLASAEAMQKDLMHTYAASYWQTLLKLRLPAAWPFIFNGLKICTTLALIGAIVAEFFGTPIVGMGFRISTEIGRMALDMVWAEIAVAALAGSVFYGLVVVAERAVTFWHPSVRGQGR